MSHFNFRFESSKDGTSVINQALILIDIQNGFREPSWGQRNNPQFEKHVERLLGHWRKAERPIFHIQHLSKEENSPLRSDLAGVEFMDFAKPLSQEQIFRKHVHSGFIGTDLEQHLKTLKIEHLVLAGLTSDHCVSTTARMGADLGFKITIPFDAVATFNRVSREGIRFSAEQVQAISLASLHQEFATISSTQELCIWASTRSL